MTILRRFEREVPVDICGDPLCGLLDLDSGTYDLFSLIIHDLSCDLYLLCEGWDRKGHEGKTEGDKA